MLYTHREDGIERTVDKRQFAIGGMVIAYLGVSDAREIKRLN